MSLSVQPNNLTTINRGYVQACTGRGYFDFEDLICKNNLKPDSEKQKLHLITCDYCNAPRWCHLVFLPVTEDESKDPHYRRYCGQTQQELKEINPKAFGTTNGFCTRCLSRGICCDFYDHPKGEELIKRELNVPSKRGKTEIPSSDEFYKFFSCLCIKDNIMKNSSIEKIGSTADDEMILPENQRRIWTFKNNPNDTRWLSEDFQRKYIFNRESYDYFLDKIINDYEKKNHNFFKIYGTPGIGKSIFLNRVFHYIIESYRNDKTNKEEIVIAYDVKRFKREEHYTISLYKKNDELKFQIFDGETKTPDYHLADTFPLRSAKKFSVYVASHKDSNLIPARPDLVGFVQYMPLFSYDELCKISPPDWTGDQRKFRYSILGGCARNYMMISSRDPVLLQEFLQEAVDLFIPEEFRTPTLENQTPTLEDQTPTLENPTPNPYYPHFLDIQTILKSTFVENFPEDDPERVNILIRTTIHLIPYLDSYISIWSSTIIKLITSYIQSKIDKRIWEQISKLISNSARGGLFESSIHHQLILSRNQVYKFKYLDENKKMQTKDVSFNISGLKYIWDTCGIAELKDNVYGLPLKQNFPAIDAIIQPNILIQITVAKKHPIEKHLLEESRANLRGERNTHMLIYIISTDILSFKINDFSYEPPQTRSKTTKNTSKINSVNNSSLTIENQNEDQNSISVPDTSQTNDILQLVGYIDVTADNLNNLTILK